MAAELAATAVSARGLVGEVAAVVVPVALCLLLHASGGLHELINKGCKKEQV